MAASVGTVRALLLAVRDRVRNVCGLSSEDCEVMPSGKPPAKCGETFVSIHPGGITLDAPEHELWTANVSIKATATVKAGKTPEDRAGLRLIASEDGLTDLAEWIAKAVHGSYTVLASANATLTATADKLGIEAQSYNEFLRCVGGIPEPQEKGPAWFGAKTSQDGPAGWAIEIRWSGGRRPEALPGESDD